MPKFTSLYIFFVLVTTVAVAQTTTPAPPASSGEPCLIAFYARDSIAIQFADAKPKYESIAKSHEKLKTIREKQVPAMDRVLTTNSESSKIEVSTLRKDSIAEEQNILKQYHLLAPTYRKIDAVADSIGKARGVKQTRESGDNSAMICPTDQMLMIDITNDVALAMGLKPKLPKIGIYNMDSLLRILPGYAIVADSLKLEKEILEAELAKRFAPVAQKQKELDSLRSSLSKKQISKREKEITELQDEYDMYRGTAVYNYHMRDSLITSQYKIKFYKALNEVHRSAGCTRSYEYPDAHRLWIVGEAEFIDLNTAISKKLMTGD